MNQNLTHPGAMTNENDAANADATELAGYLTHDPVHPGPVSSSKRWQNALKTALKIVFAAALIVWLVKKKVLDVDSLKAIASPHLIVFCLVTVGLQILINNYRWLVLMRAQNFESSFKKTMPLSLIGMFFNFAIPGGVGGDVVKGYYLLKQHPEQKFAAAVSIFMDRLIGFFVMIATAFVALFINFEEVSKSQPLQSVALGVTALFIGFITFFALAFTRISPRLLEKCPRKIKALYDAFHSYRHRPKALIGAVLLSGLNQLLIVAFVAVIGRELSVDIPLAIYFFLVPIGTVAQAIPLAPAGIGVGQAAFFFLFKWHLGHDSPIGPVSVTATQLASLAWGLVGAYFYLRITHEKPKA